MNNIGVDLGGTNLRVAKIDKLGNILDSVKMPTESDKGPVQISNKIIKAINDLKDNSTVKVGIGIPGQVDNEKKLVVQCVNINMENFPLAKLVEDGTNLPVIMNNDANVAGLGEAIIGAGRDSDIVYYITWSTGVGGSLIINKQLINGANYNTGEIGNLIMNPDHGFEHSLFNKGSLEAEVAGNAIKRYSKEINMSVPDIFSSYKEGNKREVEVIDYITDIMARALANIYHVIEVDVFVFGGGVTLNSGGVLLPLVIKKVDNYLTPAMQGKLKIKFAELGDNNGLIGAGFL